MNEPGTQPESPPEFHAAALADQAARDGVQKLVAGAIVYDPAGRVLILRRSAADDFLPGIEELPSGGAAPGEPLLAALARELHEETGLHLAHLAAAPRYVAAFDYHSGSGRLTRQFTWAVPHTGQSVRLSGEHCGHRMVPAERARACDITTETARIIQTWADLGR